MPTFLRARQPEQKEERRAHLLATARAMLEEGGDLESLSLNELARRASMTKSNVYRYFESREAVLLALLEEEWRAWAQAMTAAFRTAPSGRDPLAHVVGHLARSLARRPRLCLLTSALPSVLERNLGEDAIREFKLRSLSFLDGVAGFVAAHAPGMTREAARRLVHDATALLGGLYPLAHPADAVRRALRAPELRFFERDLESDLERLLLAVARDLVGPR